MLKEVEISVPRLSQKEKDEIHSYQALYEKSEYFLRKLMIKNLPEDSKIFLFGSRAEGNHSRSSDIDIGVISKKLDEKMIVKLKEIIDDSFVPFKVDIVDFSRADKKFKNKALKRIVQWK